MAKDLSTQLWHGIPRKEIPWYPTIIAEKCIGCELCYISCGREVFEYFGKKELPKHLKTLIANRPFDVVNFQMHVPTLKGADEGAPCYSSFELTSTEQADISAFGDEVRNSIKKKGIVLVSETKL
ncbi:MAG: ferredoxin family protein [Ignavibacteriaceae bacterium]